MKFGEQLKNEIFPPWRLSYISYDVLKQELKSRQLDHAWTEEDEEEFIQKLENELEKVYDFVSAKLAEVEARISYCERTIQTFINNPTWSSEQNWTVMNDALTEVLFDVNDLAKFTRLNYIGFQKIIKKHDKWTGLCLMQDFIPQLRAKPLDKQRFDVAIVFISALLDLCKKRGKSRPFSSASVMEGDENENYTEKYWVHPDNITEVKSIIMLHLPVFIYNKEKIFDPSDATVSSVYLDNDTFGLYTSLLQRDEGAESIKCKWHGSFNTPNVSIERTTHLADWADGNSIKERFQLSTDQVQKFLTGKLTTEQICQSMMAKGVNDKLIDECRFLALGIEESIREKKLKPACRIVYHRTLFQIPEEPELSIRMDNDLVFIREDNYGDMIRRDPDEWRRSDAVDYPFNQLDESEILHFPYAVLEVKTPQSNHPRWLKKLLESHLVHEVPRFSKYLHGASYLFRDHIPLLPWWISEMEIDIRKPRSTNFGLTRSKSFKPLIDGQYKRAMEQEQLRMDVVNESVQPNSFLNTDPSASDNQQWENRPHRMRSTLVTKGDDPLNYGPLHERKIKKKDREAGNLGEDVNFDHGDNIRLDIDLPPEEKKLFGAKSGMVIRDPNNPNGVIPIKKVKVEPKVFFSNERTFIAWLQFCALLLTVALNLLNFGDDTSRIAGALFLSIAAVIAIYALYQYEKRAW